MSGFVVLCFLVFTFKEALGQTTKVTQCQLSNGTLPINAYVVGCIEPPCLLPQLEDAVINVAFKAPYLLHSMTTKARAILTFWGSTTDMEYNLEYNAVTCNFLTNTYCPVLQDEVVQYSLNMFIKSLFLVGISATIEFRVEDQDELPVWCIRLPIRIASPRQT